VTFRILSLDGGGVRGLLTARILHRLEQEVPGWIDQVDLIAGTSAGGITALALAQGESPAFLVELYDRLAPQVFNSSGHDGLRGLRKFVRAKYDNFKLSEAVSTVFDGATLDRLEKRVLIVAFELDGEEQEQTNNGWQPKIFHNIGYEKQNGSLSVSKLALYTSATPCIFPSIDGYVDGGVIANNPSLVALALVQDRDLLTIDRPQLDEIELLSVGTGHYRRGIEGKSHDWGYIHWSKYLFDMMVEGGVMLTDRLCQQFLGERYHRISPVIPSHCRADDWKSKEELICVSQDLDIERSISWLKRHWNTQHRRSVSYKNTQ